MYGMWNLDFYRMNGSPLCLHPRVSTLQVITLDYAIALYPLVLIFIILMLWFKFMIGQQSFSLFGSH